MTGTKSTSRASLDRCDHASHGRSGGADCAASDGRGISDRSVHLAARRGWPEAVYRHLARYLRTIRDEIRLAQSEARLRGVLDSAMDAIITIDERQHIVLFNSAAEVMFGCSQQDAVGAPLNGFIPERFRAAHGEHVRSFGETPTASRRMGEQRIVTGLRRNGDEFPIDASISQLGSAAKSSLQYPARCHRTRPGGASVAAVQGGIAAARRSAHQAREQEKSRISRELHDELGQALTALQMDVAWFRQRTPQGEPALTAKLDRMEALLDTTVAPHGALRPICAR